MRGSAVVLLSALSLLAAACGTTGTQTQSLPTPVGTAFGTAAPAAQPTGAPATTPPAKPQPVATVVAAATAAASPAPSPASGAGSPPPKPQGSPSPGVAQTPTPLPASTQAPTGTTSAPATAVPTAAPAPATRPPSVVDLTRLPLGDGKRSTSAQVGWLWSCSAQVGGGGAFRQGPWISGTTWDLTKKISVDGNVSWQHQFSAVVSGTDRVITSNGLPPHGTGVYPVARTDDAYAYDPNPNRITAQSLSYRMPANPRLNASPQCAGGTVGIAITGGAIFNAFDAQAKDAVANEIQDSCGGHPERTGQYHYHGIPSCITDTPSGHSRLFGYAFDGFGIFGPRDTDGRTLANADLDECHGHTHEIEWDGVKRVLFHYHFTYEFPYSVSCYRGQPVRTGP